MKRVTSRKSTSTSTSQKCSSFVRESLVSTPRKVLRNGVQSYPARTFSYLSRAAAAVLIAFFILVPVADAYADTSEVALVNAPVVEVSVSTLEDASVPEVGTTEETVASPTEEVVAEAPPLLPAVEAEPEEVPTEEVSSTDIASTTSEVEVTVEEEVSTDSADEEVPVVTDDVVATSTPDTETPSTTDNQNISTSTESIASTTNEAVEPFPLPESGTTTPETPVATTAPEVMPLPATSTPPEVVSSGTHTTDADVFSFSTTECIPLGNGAFQCVRSEQNSIANTERGEVYAARDASGDFEIYRNTDAAPLAITNNDVDDQAPSLDRVTGDVVWHAQIDDRSQIVHYSARTGATTKLTKEAYNSMQPMSFDGDVVFQSWIGDDWEVVLIDNEDGREILTDNDAHDIAPSITKEFITWQSFEENAWVAKVFDRRTHEVQTVRGMEGGVVENPRMVMVFDNKKENGDIETVGYDPIAGEIVPLAVTPVPLPERIPEPEEEQEEKALLPVSSSTRTENKTASSTDTDDEPEVQPASTTPSVTPVDEVATTTDTFTLDLSAPIPSQTEQSTIADLVVPSFNAQQNEVASTTTE